MSGRLTTHILDTAHGRPAGGVLIELWRIDAGAEEETRARIHTERTNEDGRTTQPLLSGGDFRPGTYELVFLIGQYFADLGAANADILFLDRVPVRFGISDPSAHYHVPLLVSPWSYATYRGS